MNTGDNCQIINFIVTDKYQDQAMVDGGEHPLDPRSAFSLDNEVGFDSRVTLILLLGAMYGIERAPVLESLRSVRDEFVVPKFEHGARLQTRDGARRVASRYEIEPTNIQSLATPEPSYQIARRRKFMAELVGDLYERPNAETAGDILFLGLGDSNEFVRTAAAISFVDLFNEIGLAIRALLSVIDEGVDELARQMAEIALRRVGAVASTPISIPPITATPTAKLDSTIIVHGSHFAFVGSAIGDWWKPGGNFHSFLKSKYRPNLYSKPDFYTWSGGWSDHARQLAAIALRDWSRQRQFSNFDVVAHSHGGNVAFWATQIGVELNNLILLSCPVHFAKYQPEFSRVRRIISYQIKLDWVILTDGGGTDFNRPEISDVVIPRWFRRHDDTHDPAIWQRHGLSI